jgi:hypothetical protein
MELELTKQADRSRHSWAMTSVASVDMSQLGCVGPILYPDARDAAWSRLRAPGSGCRDRGYGAGTGHRGRVAKRECRRGHPEDAASR